MDFKLALRVAKDNWNDKEWWRDTAIPFGKRTVLAGILRPYYRFFGPQGEDFTEQDWDNLLILDACRYDMFEDVCEIDGTLESTTSVGSSTPEFLKRTFRNGSFPETVYVTANPQVNLRLNVGIFHDVVNVWENEWDDDLGTVRPEKVTDAALEAQNRYPNKRLIVHYMQPHYPFIGDLSGEIEGHSGFELTKRLANNEEANRDHRTVWDKLKEGEVSKEVVWEAYLENLKIVLDDIQGSIEEFQGKTVITSDHGNLLGEVTTPLGLELYGHPTGIHAENLVTVPWLTYKDGTRKEIMETSQDAHVEQQTEGDQEIINERLEDLGYA